MYILFAEEEAERDKKTNQPKDMILGTPIDPMMNPLNPPSN
jgi:hypothetical protein